ncbi:indole-3-glycerol phosphate synthase TrpC [Candidatus Marinamargulisbacteria bacterium SCGC AG-343-D04]|nr:indole-3-glycerol phosphate synthase TrpC [Candidatus Marinamargulisbacteria bacterium SCGC AG-343-D04]
MHSILEDILKYKKDYVKQLKSSFVRDLSMERSHKKSRFFEALSQPGLSLISEIKKASPSKGLINPDFNPLDLAHHFEKGGSSAFSILTDEPFFQGKNDYLMSVNKVSSMPILRKDFILDPIQVEESYHIGADAILIILAILDVDQAQELIDKAYELGMDVLIEIHSEEDVACLRKLSDVRIIGVNNRDLHSFDVDINRSLHIKETIYEEFPGCLFVAESGYHSVQQLDGLSEYQFDAVLIGEGLIKEPSLLDYFK